MDKNTNRENTFFKSLTVLATSSLAAQIILALHQILLARVFSAESLGAYNFLLAVPMAFVGVICGRYDLAIVYEKDEKKIFPLVKLNFLVNIAVSTLVTAGYIVYIVIFKAEYVQYLYLFPFMFLYMTAYGLTNMLNSYNNRYKDYKMIAKMYFVRTLAQCLGMALPGVVMVYFLKMENLSVPILLIPYCIGMFFGVFTQGKFLFENRKQIAEIPMKEVLETAGIHKKQPLLSAPAIFANSFSYSLMTMISEGFGKACAGYYSISTRLLGMPISLISGNLSKVYMEEASKEYNETGGYKRAFDRTFKFLMVIAVPMFLAMYFLAPAVCGFVLGEDWVVAGEYIKALSVMFTFRFVSTALSPGLYACRKQQTEFAVQALLLAVTVGAGIAAKVFGFDIITFLYVVGALRSAVMLFQVIMVFIYSRGTKKQDELI